MLTERLVSFDNDPLRNIITQTLQRSQEDTCILRSFLEERKIRCLFDLKIFKEEYYKQQDLELSLHKLETANRNFADDIEKLTQEQDSYKNEVNARRQEVVYQRAELKALQQRCDLLQKTNDELNQQRESLITSLAASAAEKNRYLKKHSELETKLKKLLKNSNLKQKQITNASCQTTREEPGDGDIDTILDHLHQNIESQKNESPPRISKRKISAALNEKQHKQPAKRTRRIISKTDIKGKAEANLKCEAEPTEVKDVKEKKGTRKTKRVDLASSSLSNFAVELLSSAKRGRALIDCSRAQESSREILSNVRTPLRNRLRPRTKKCYI